MTHDRSRRGVTGGAAPRYERRARVVLVAFRHLGHRRATGSRSRTNWYQPKSWHQCRVFGMRTVCMVGRCGWGLCCPRRRAKPWYLREDLLLARIARHLALAGPERVDDPGAIVAFLRTNRMTLTCDANTAAIVTPRIGCSQHRPPPQLLSGSVNIFGGG